MLRSLALTAASVFATAQAQYSLRLVVTGAATRPQEDIYVTGSFNNWSAPKPEWKLKPFAGGRRVIVIKDLAAGDYEFRFLRGDIAKGETKANGEDIPPHKISLKEDASVESFIAGWKDDFPDKPKPNTATAQVHLLDSAFVIPQLGRTRRIWIYLPKSYTAAKGKYYPVIYMQDGQNVFNERTAFAGEWGADECLDSLSAKGRECIVVAIANGETKRLNEYNPWDHPKYGPGEGKAYAEFLATTLKPFIDSHYRTLKDPVHNTVLGSSMGGLISLYTVMKYPAQFGVAGMFSPSFAVAPQVFDEMANQTWTSMPRFYFYTGGKEGPDMQRDAARMADLVGKKAQYDIRSTYYPNGQHNEEAWRKEFADFVRWLLR